jgi:3-hydroxyisobutyrate dehydrogenase
MTGLIDKPALAVGFIGLGRMGSPMAANLATAGYRLSVWNRSREKAEVLSQRIDCEVVDSPAEVAANSDVVITMVSDGKILESIYFDDPAFVAGLESGIALDMSTIGPDYAKALGRRLNDAGVDFVEAPVSGSTAAAEGANLTIMVGASEADFGRIRGVLGALGQPVLHLGEVGSASLMKLAINSLIYGINQCLSEALVLADKGGVDLELAYDAILESAAAAPVMGYRRESFLHPEDQPVHFALKLEKKDLELTIELAKALGASMPQAALNMEIVGDALQAGWAEEDIACIARYLKETDR